MKSRRFIFLKIISKLHFTRLKHLNFRSIAHNQYLDIFFRYFSFYNYISKSSNFAFASKVKPVCIVSGRSRAIVNDFYFSRLVFKEYSIAGHIFGFKKSQW